MSIIPFSRPNELRIEVKIPLMGHNCSRFFEGVVVSISQSGALLLLEQSSLKVGDKLKFQLNLGNNLKVFSFEGRVVKTKKPISIFRENHDTDPYYAIEFDEPQEFILEHFQFWSKAA